MEKILFDVSESQSWKPNQKNISVYTPGTKMYNYSHGVSVAIHDSIFFHLYLSLLRTQTSPILINPNLTLGSYVPNKGSHKLFFFQKAKLQIFIQLPHYWD